MKKLMHGQSFIEYCLMMVIVAAALAAMTSFLLRSTNARIQQSRNELNYYSVE